MKKDIIPIFIPHLGCPHDCVFCNQRRIATTEEATKESARNTIEEYLSYFRDGAYYEIAFYGGSFTAVDISLQKDLLSVAYEYKNRGIIKEIRLSTRPDAIDKNILKMLKSYGVDTIELGVQSSVDRVLELSSRGHDFTSVVNAAKQIKDFGFTLGLQQMIGLPSSKEADEIKTANEFVKLKPDFVRIYPTLVVKDTELEYRYNNELYTPLRLEEAVKISAKLLEIYKRNDIDVIRIGLQPTEEINYDGSVVAGPFHPAFRQLVETYLITEKIIDTLNGIDEKDLLIICSGRNISMISGQKRAGIEKIKSKLKIKNIKFREEKIGNEIILKTMKKSYKISF